MLLKGFFFLSSFIFLLQWKIIASLKFSRGLNFLLKTYQAKTETSSSDEAKSHSKSNFVYSLDEKEREFSSSAEYVKYLASIATLPKGFKVGAIRFPFQPLEVQKQLPMNLSMILLDESTTSYAAAFTSNQFPGGPILVGKQRLQSSEHLQAIIINNKISNVCPNGVQDFGYQDSDRLCEKLAETFQLSSKQSVLPSSTGIIGWRLPIDTMIEKLPLLKPALQKESVLPIALGIMTTDRYPKIRSYRSPKNNWSIVGTNNFIPSILCNSLRLFDIQGIAKGAGMIEPNLATMLSYLLTDLHLSKAQLQRSLQKVLSSTYNSISVDGDQSTSDTVVLLSSRQSHPSPVDDDPALIEEFENALYSICYKLSEDIVRNGEGTQHVVRVKVKGIHNEKISKSIGKSIINSSLVKCAIAGNDPNVGRIVSSIGSILGNTILPLLQSSNNILLNVKEGETKEGGEGKKKVVFEKDHVRISLGKIVIFEKGGFQLDPVKEDALFEYLSSCQLYNKDIHEHDRTYPPHERCVDLLIEFLPSSEQDNHESDVVYEVLGSDLTKEYVEINADYRS